jgi:hypothetical protein
VPWEGHGDLLSGLAPELAGKILVDCVNPMGFDTHGAYLLPVAEGRAAQQAAALLPGSTWSPSTALQGARRAAHHRHLSAGGRPARGDLLTT